MTASRRLWIGLSAALLLFASIQLVPYGRDHTNPPDGMVVTFDSPRTQELAERACYDCHSNHTRWPWYASVAPMSWRIQTHVHEGRAKLNFTAFDPGSHETAEAVEEAGETVTKGEMPPADYRLAHREARLTPAEKQALATGLDRTLAPFAEGGDAHRRAEPGRAEHEGDDEKSERDRD